MKAVDRIEEYLIKHRFMSIRKGKELGYKTPGNAIGYLMCRGHEIVSVNVGARIGSFTAPERGYYLVKAAERPETETKEERPDPVAVRPEKPEKTVCKEERPEKAEEVPEKTIDGLITKLEDKRKWYEDMGCGGTLSVKIMAWVISELEEIRASA